MAMTLDEKIAKAEATAKARAEKEGFDEAATKALVDEAVQKVKDAEVSKNTQATEGLFVVSVKNNTSYCGVGAGGIQFANGKAEIKDSRMADWFKEHEGYTVTQQ